MSLLLGQGEWEGGKILPQPNNNPKQLKTTFVGVVLLSVRKTTPPPPRGFHYN